MSDSESTDSESDPESQMSGYESSDSEHGPDQEQYMENLRRDGAYANDATADGIFPTARQKRDAEEAGHTMDDTRSQTIKRRRDERALDSRTRLYERIKRQDQSGIEEALKRYDPGYEHYDETVAPGMQLRVDSTNGTMYKLQFGHQLDANIKRGIEVYDSDENRPVYNGDLFDFLTTSPDAPTFWRNNVESLAHLIFEKWPRSRNGKLWPSAKIRIHLQALTCKNSDDGVKYGTFNKFMKWQECNAIVFANVKSIQRALE